MAPRKYEPSDEDFRRAFALVGKFMFTWAHVEGILNESVGKLMGIDDGVSETILTANMTVREKLNVIRTSLLLGLDNASDEWRKTSKLMDALGDRNGDRNIVAHNQFGPRPDGVTFFMVKAKGEFAIPDLVWTTRDFEERGEKMRTLALQLLGVVDTEVAARADFSPPRTLVAQFGGPTGDTPTLELAGRPTNPPQDDPRSPQTTP